MTRAEALDVVSTLLGVTVVDVERDPPPQPKAMPGGINDVPRDVWGNPAKRGWWLVTAKPYGVDPLGRPCSRLRLPSSESIRAGTECEAIRARLTGRRPAARLTHATRSGLLAAMHTVVESVDVNEEGTHDDRVASSASPRARR
jgi:hypothetical protein